MYWLIRAVEKSHHETAAVAAAVGPAEHETDRLTVSYDDGNINRLTDSPKSV